MHENANENEGKAQVAGQNPETPVTTECTDTIIGDRAIKLIVEEQRRQIKELGYTPEHDDGLTGGQLAVAAICYATPPEYRALETETNIPINWPFEDASWKPVPDSRIRELVKAGSLIVAEIERTLRLNDEKASNQ